MTDDQPSKSSESKALQKERSPDAVSGQVEDDSACIDCGYKLRGLKLTADCPECGLAVRISRDRLSGISSRQFCTLALRIAATVLVVLPLIGEFGLINSLAWLLIDADAFSYLDKTQIVFVFVGPLIKMAIGVVLWFLAPLVACLIAPHSVPLILNAGGSRNLMWMLVGLLAVWMVFTGAESLLVIFTAYSMERNDLETPSYGQDYPVLFVSGFFRVVAGIFLIGWLIRRRKLEI